MPLLCYRFSVTLGWSDIDVSLWVLPVSVLPWVCVLMDPRYLCCHTN